MQRNNYEERGIVVLQLTLLILLGSVLKGLKSGLTVGIAEIDILEAKILSDLIVVRNIDAYWDAAGTEGEYL
jgi:hypothetical protein